MAPKVNVRQGEKFGKLTIIGIGSSNKHRQCKCECGNITNVKLCNLTSGNSKSCGCGKVEWNKKHVSDNNTKHGMYGTPVYKTWNGMKNRCKRDLFYIRKGIKVHPYFEKFENFYDYIGDKPSPEYSIDRIDGKKGYEPGNVRWATWGEQMENRNWGV